jgi:hypothetical protein
MDDAPGSRGAVPCGHDWFIVSRRPGLDVVECVRCHTRETRDAPEPDNDPPVSFDFRGYDLWRSTDPRDS